MTVKGHTAFLNYLSVCRYHLQAGESQHSLNMPMPPGSNIQEFSKPEKNVLKLNLKKEQEKEKAKASKFGDLVSLL